MPCSARHAIPKFSFLAVALGLVVPMAGCQLGDAPPGAAAAVEAAGGCPQPRQTERAPDSYFRLVNPLPASAQHLERGRALYEAERSGGSCASCHGREGDGLGPAALGLTPPPRNFACAETMQGLSDGQLFWVIENGSGALHLPARQGAQQAARPGRRQGMTSMSAYGQQFSDTEIWQLVLYMRTFSAPPARPKELVDDQAE
jgi:mono/diheme cytochrome c family protein